MLAASCCWLVEWSCWQLTSQGVYTTCCLLEVEVGVEGVKLCCKQNMCCVHLMYLVTSGLRLGVGT